MLTSGFAEPAAGYAAAAAAATGYDAEGARNAIRERMTYAPKTAEGVRYMSELARVMSAVNNSAPVTTWKKALILLAVLPNGWVRRCKRFQLQLAWRQAQSLHCSRADRFQCLLSVCRTEWLGMRWLRESCILRLGFFAGISDGADLAALVPPWKI